MADAPWVPLLYLDLYEMKSKRVGGFAIHPVWLYTLRGDRRMSTVFGSVYRRRKCGVADQRTRRNNVISAAMLSADAATWR